MCQINGLSESIFSELFKEDNRTADHIRTEGCPHCGGALYAGDYPRKPRGIPAAMEPFFAVRRSFCCANANCRRRVTPPSVRFLGRKVYVGGIVVVAVVALLDALFFRTTGEKPVIVPRRTVRRWRTWWSDVCPASPTWMRLRGLLPSELDTSRLPLSLLSLFGDISSERALFRALQFLSPLTTRPPKDAGNPMGA